MKMTQKLRKIHQESFRTTTIVNSLHSVEERLITLVEDGVAHEDIFLLRNRKNELESDYFDSIHTLHSLLTKYRNTIKVKHLFVEKTFRTIDQIIKLRGWDKPMKSFLVSYNNVIDFPKK